MSTASSPVRVYGIPNCNTVKKARVWLDEHGIAYVFHDFKKQGVPADHLAAWVKAVGWQPLVNRQGTTWRKLAPEVQAAVVDQASATALMTTQASVIKRPVVEWPQGKVTVGFAEADWAALVG
jgi:arsenate reductase (glutaredoxin)